MAEGYCEDRFSAIKEGFTANIANDLDCGASFVVNINGKNVIDIWGGHNDTARSKPWTKDTITTIWATTVTITAMAAMLLVDRGLISLSDPVCNHWPEFAQRGKENVTIAHLLSHQSGLSGWEAQVFYEDILDVPWSTKLLERQAPWWEPGTGSGYHMATYGHLVGEVIRRVTGKTLGQFITDELAEPLSADFRLGCPENEASRIADTVPGPPATGEGKGAGHVTAGSIAFKTYTGPPPDALIANTPEWRKSELGAANGISNARGVARLLSIITGNGTVDGKQYMKPETVELFFQEQSYTVDHVVNSKVRYSLGFGLAAEDGATREFVPQDHKMCYWGGQGGSLAIVDMDHKMTISYVMNRMELGRFGNTAGRQYVTELYKILGQGHAA
ncbi:Hypothetical protein D9617_13g100780 [Elsinoe fawcettii]|nr:Hypothetical protein D9617_13g100780 [Elsinoe fawcettii]